MSEEDSYANDFLFKVVLIGEGAVGKTSLIRQFTKGTFNKEYIKTLGAQFSRYDTVIEEDNVKARLFFWDIAGQVSFSFMRQTFYQGSKAAIIVFDMSRPETVESVQTWYDDIAGFCGKIPTIVFANKSDLVDGESFDTTEIERLVAENEFLDWYMTSARTGKQIHDAFNHIIRYLVKKATEMEQ